MSYLYNDKNGIKVYSASAPTLIDALFKSEKNKVHRVSDPKLINVIFKSEMNDVLKTQRRMRLLIVFGQLLFLVVAALLMLAGAIAGGYFFIFFCFIGVLRLFVFGTLPTVISDCGKLKRGDLCSQSDTLEHIQDARSEEKGLPLYSYNVVKLRKLGWFRIENCPEIVKKYKGKSVSIVSCGRHFIAIVLPYM